MIPAQAQNAWAFAKEQLSRNDIYQAEGFHGRHSERPKGKSLREASEINSLRKEQFFSQWSLA